MVVHHRSRSKAAREGPQKAPVVATCPPGEMLLESELRAAQARSIVLVLVALVEPLSALDVPSRRAVRAFLGGYLRHLGLPTLVVTHAAADARQLGHRIAVLEAGTITQTGTWSELVAQPASAFVAELVAPGAGPAVGDVGAA